MRNFILLPQIVILVNFVYIAYKIQIIQNKSYFDKIDSVLTGKLKFKKLSCFSMQNMHNYMGKQVCICSL